MEKRQLDFNAPLLSVRRYSSPTNSSELVRKKTTEKPNRQQSLPLQRSNYELEEVTKPAAVPFHWEQIPGRPKNGLETQIHTPEESSATPRLPPGRISGEITKYTGRLSGPTRFHSGEMNIYRPGQVETVVDHASLLQKLNESLNYNNESGSESGEDSYSDALDTLSQTESTSFNYSVSGLSGYQNSDTRPSGTFSIDSQTRDFMMNRFLPAAKAVVIETPQYIVKKPLKVSEHQPKETKALVLKQYDCDAKPYYSEYNKGNFESEEEKEFPVPVKKPGKIWGILPRFCRMKNSLCLLNPLIGMKSKYQIPKVSSGGGDVRRLTRNAHSGPLDKHTIHVPPKKKFYSGLLSRDLAVDSNQFSHTRNSFQSGLSPLRRNKSGSISPYRNESPKSPFREGVGFLGLPKEVENRYNSKTIASSPKSNFHDGKGFPCLPKELENNAKKIASSRKMFKALQDVSRNQIEKAPATNLVHKKEATTEEGKTLSPKLQNIKILGQESRQLESVQVSSNVNLVMKDENDIEFDPACLKSPLTPPLPKSPSESWLWHTLPSIQNPFSHSRRRNQLHDKKGSNYDNTKWEMIVKTSNRRHDHIRYSEELAPHTSQRQNKS